VENPLDPMSLRVTKKRCRLSPWSACVVGVVRRLPCVVVRVHCEGFSDEGRKLRCSFALAVVLFDLTN
jgi:hypothetical protein